VAAGAELVVALLEVAEDVPPSLADGDDVVSLDDAPTPDLAAVLEPALELDATGAAVDAEPVVVDAAAFVAGSASAPPSAAATGAAAAVVAAVPRDDAPPPASEEATPPETTSGSVSRVALTASCFWTGAWSCGGAGLVGDGDGRTVDAGPRSRIGAADSPRATASATASACVSYASPGWPTPSSS
jgi:hypothetical protein